jgi:hypothetical protein
MVDRGRRREYVVIANVGSTPAQLYDPNHPLNPWKLIGQKSTGKDTDMFVFPAAMTLAPGERIILSATSPDLFRQEQKIPASVRIFGPLNSGLSSTGERVALAAPLEQSWMRKSAMPLSMKSRSNQASRRWRKENRLARGRYAVYNDVERMAPPL